MNKILILFAHPALHKSRVNIRLTEAVKWLNGITFNDLYENYPDFYIDIKKEQRLLTEHDVVVWHHPFYWYSCPALLKEWIDLVLEHNFAYGREGKALAGKKILSVISTGGAAEVYSETGKNRFPISQFLIPFRQTAGLCGMEYLPPFVVHGSHLLTPPEIEHYAAQYTLLIKGLRDGLFTTQQIQHAVYLNELV